MSHKSLEWIACKIWVYSQNPALSKWPRLIKIKVFTYSLVKWPKTDRNQGYKMDDTWICYRWIWITWVLHDKLARLPAFEWVSWDDQGQENRPLLLAKWDSEFFYDQYFKKLTSVSASNEIASFLRIPESRGYLTLKCTGLCLRVFTNQPTFK